jgi:hypothetical protein
MWRRAARGRALSVIFGFRLSDAVAPAPAAFPVAVIPHMLGLGASRVLERIGGPGVMGAPGAGLSPGPLT